MKNNFGSYSLSNPFSWKYSGGVVAVKSNYIKKCQYLGVHNLLTNHLNSVDSTGLNPFSPEESSGGIQLGSNPFLPK